METWVFTQTKMAIILSGIILNYIDEVMDIDDLENLGDYVHSVIANENIDELHLNESLRLLYNDLLDAYNNELDFIRRLRLKAAIVHLEADFTEYLIEKETESFKQRKN